MATASIIRPLTRTNPGYIASRFYPMNVVGIPVLWVGT